MFFEAETRHRPDLFTFFLSFFVLFLFFHSSSCPGPPVDLATLETFARDSHASVLSLQMEAADLLASSSASSTTSLGDLDHAASHLGTSYGLVAVLRGSVRHAQKRRSYLPMDLCAAAGISTEDIYRGRADRGAICDVVFEVAKVAKGHLHEAMQLSRDFEREAQLTLMMPAVPAGMTLALLERVNFDIFSPQLQRGMMGGLNPLALQAKLIWSRIIGRPFV